jgi:metal-responsive CopG/Arc/MetJ family transcriptional regulator
MLSAVRAVVFEPVTGDESKETREPKTIRLEPSLWTKLGPAALSNGHDRSSVIRQLVRWYLSEPGAQLPQRPERTD